jgi:hypothetical protein
MVLFETDPLQRTPELAGEFVSQNPVAELNLITEEIQLELDHPTQNVREILDNPQTEDQCRAFLEAFVRCVRSEIELGRQ